MKDDTRQIAPLRTRAAAQRGRARRHRDPARARRLDGRTGLAAKPIIEVLVSVAEPDDEATFAHQLEAAGYELRVRLRRHEPLREAKTPLIDAVIARASGPSRSPRG